MVHVWVQVQERLWVWAQRRLSYCACGPPKPTTTCMT